MSNRLCRLTYRSRCRVDSTAAERLADLRAILDKSRVNNPLINLTGMLMFDGFGYLQIVEGAPDKVEHLYERIASDSRHEELEIIELSAIQRREYGEWSMAFVDAKEDAKGHLHKQRLKFENAVLMIDEDFHAQIRRVLNNTAVEQ